jgi:hypothetical protein
MHHGLIPASAVIATLATLIAEDQYLIAETEGPSFISRTVARRRLDRLRS